jgi:hypothetical protein
VERERDNLSFLPVNRADTRNRSTIYEVVFVKGALIEDEILPTIAGPEADMSNFGAPAKTTLLKVDEYKKVDFPKMSLSQVELERYLNNQDSIFDIEVISKP